MGRKWFEVRNYSFNDNEAKDFILSYEIISNNIIITYGNGESKTIGYSINGEKAILEKMREQVLGSKALLADVKVKTSIFSKLFWDLILLLFMFLISVFSIGMPLMATIMGLSIFTIGIVFTGYKARHYKILRDDIRKHWLFLDNEDCLNVAIRNNQEVAKKLDSNLRDKIFGDNKGIPFSLNTIDRLNYRELSTIYKQVRTNTQRKRNRVRRRRKKKNSIDY